MVRFNQTMMVFPQMAASMAVTRRSRHKRLDSLNTSSLSTVYCASRSAVIASSNAA